MGLYKGVPEQGWFEAGVPQPDPSPISALWKTFIWPLAGSGVAHSSLLKENKYSATSMSAVVLLQSGGPRIPGTFKRPYI